MLKVPLGACSSVTVALAEPVGVVVGVPPGVGVPVVGVPVVGVPVVTVPVVGIGVGAVVGAVVGATVGIVVTVGGATVDVGTTGVTIGAGVKVLTGVPATGVSAGCICRSDLAPTSGAARRVNSASMIEPPNSMLDRSLVRLRQGGRFTCVDPLCLQIDSRRT
jgi:hypothetical protein